MARAQQGERVRRIGVLIPFDENDPLPKPRIFAFTQALADLGWTNGRNVRIDLRWSGGAANRIQALAQKLVGQIGTVRTFRSHSSGDPLRSGVDWWMIYLVSFAVRQF
jgi:hypothetical protein